MNLWENKRYKEIYRNTNNNGGIKLINKNVSNDLELQIKDFCLWLEKKYEFPVRINLTINKNKLVKMSNGNKVYGLFKYYGTHDDIDIIIPTGGYPKLWDTYDLLGSLIHELTHYMQWINQIDQTDAESEKESNYYRFRILDEYLKH